MSKITTVYNALVTEIDSLLTSVAGYSRIPNPEDLEKNNKTFMTKAWGFYYSGAAPSETDFNKFSNDHVFTTVLSRKLVTLDSATTQRDTLAKELLEDAYTLQKNIYNYSQLSVEESIAKIDLGSISEVQQAFEGKYIYITLDFNITIWEDF